MNNEYSVFLGLDVGKTDHHAVGLDPVGKRLHDAPLPNSEPKLRAMFDKLAAHGPVLVVVDQPCHHRRPAGHRDPGLRTRGRLPARTAMRRIADLYPGNAKTDARDAFIIADAARTLPPCSADS
jgi:hypothetical protein